MDPDRDWRWLNRIHSQIQVRHRPARPKRPRLVSSLELFELGTGLMARAEQEDTNCAAAITYRDGLIIALLAARPLRLRNLTGLDLDHTLLRRGPLWWIEFSESETKTNNVIELPWPEALIAALETYLARHRHVLANMRGGSLRPVGDALWVSSKGSPMTRNGIYWCITKRTRDAFGHSISPHLFRDCAATSIAIDDPRHVGIAAPLLGHRSASTTEKYYNQAGSIEASPDAASVPALPAPQRADRGRARLVGKVLTRLYRLLPRVAAGVSRQDEAADLGQRIHRRGAGCRCRRRRNCQRIMSCRRRRAGSPISRHARARRFRQGVCPPQAGQMSSDRPTSRA